MTDEYIDQLIQEVELEILADPEAFDWDNKYEYGNGYHE